MCIYWIIISVFTVRASQLFIRKKLSSLSAVHSSWPEFPAVMKPALNNCELLEKQNLSKYTYMHADIQTWMTANNDRGWPDLSFLAPCHQSKGRYPRYFREAAAAYLCTLFPRPTTMPLSWPPCRSCGATSGWRCVNVHLFVCADMSLRLWEKNRPLPKLVAYVAF